MKSLLNKFVIHYSQFEEFQRQVDEYERAIQTKEWKFLKDTILVIKSEMIQQLLSKEFTDMNAEDKDVLQKTYYNINQILDYLESPARWFKHINRFKQVLTPNFKSKGKPN
jgi:hypothetical protein